MIQSLRKYVALPQIPVTASVAVGTFATFGWLLVQDQIHPILIYCLQLFLSF